MGALAAPRMHGEDRRTLASLLERERAAVQAPAVGERALARPLERDDATLDREVALLVDAVGRSRDLEAPVAELHPEMADVAPVVLAGVVAGRLLELREGDVRAVDAIDSRSAACVLDGRRR